MNEPGGYQQQSGFGSAPGGYEQQSGFGEPPPAGDPPPDPGSPQPGYDQPPGYGQPSPSGPPPEYGQQSAYGQPFAQPGYGRPVYGQPAYGQPGYGQPAYGQGFGPPGYAQPAYAQPGYGPGGDPTDVLGARIGQYLLDALVASVPPLALGFLLIIVGAGVVESSEGLGGTLLALGFAVVFLGSIAASFYTQAYWPTTHGGQTPAMGWLNLRVVREEDGGVPTLGQCAVRWLLLILIDAGLIGLIVVAASSRHQRLGDMAAKTLVVRT